MLDESRLKTFMNHASSVADAYEIELLYTSKQECLARFGNNRISQHIAEEDIDLSFRVQKGLRQGCASCNQTDPATIQKTIRRAISIAEAQPEELSLLPMPSAQTYQRLNHVVPPTQKGSPAMKVEQIKQAISKIQRRKLKAAGFYSNGIESVALANSNGLLALGAYTTATFGITIMTDDSSGWAERTDKDIRNIDPVALANTALLKAEQSRKPRPIEPGPYTVILEPAAVADLLLFMAWESLGALPYLEARSFMSGKLGQRIMDPRVSIRDDVYHPNSVGISFDYEGSPRQRTLLIEKGVAQAVVHDRKTARKEGRSSTGHALPQPNTMGPFPSNLVMSPGKDSISEMISNTDRGLLVTHFHYTNLLEPIPLSITGMTRDATFLIEHGKIRGPVKNMRFTESILDCFNRIEAVGLETDYVNSFWGSGIVAPSLKIRDFNFSSKTTF